RAYTRNLVDRGNGKSNLLILVWTPGKASPVHDHANAHCIMKILRGSLKETVYNWPKDVHHEHSSAPLEIKKETIYGENGVTYISDKIGLHRISNPDPKNFVVSLHQRVPFRGISSSAALPCVQLTAISSLSHAWFASIWAASTYLFLDDPDEPPPPIPVSTRIMRLTRLLSILAIVAFAVFTTLYLRAPPIPSGLPWHATSSPSTEPYTEPPAASLEPLRHSDSQAHPVDHLVREAEAKFLATLEHQSGSLEDAVAEYRRRYRIPPPPNFDKWFRFARQKGVTLIDEYDTIYHSLLPFWGLEPRTIRARVREALGFDANMLIGLFVRDGEAAHIHGGQEWQQKATIGMMAEFIRYLPDMDLAFNMHDEPRVVVPHDELSRLVSQAVDKRMPAAFANPSPRNAFSLRPQDVSNGKRVGEVKTTRFNVFAHQPTWIPSRLSCSPSSPARALDDVYAVDNLTAYALGDLGFIYNHTAFSDICNSPSFASSHGFFDRPNAFNVVHDLFPIFSQSKMSSFQDILYPSPWYWYGKVSYDRHKDMDWEAKENKLWWRGSTTGGFSRDGGWRRQHRQQL
ncbi:hypothetical protein LTR28_009598, partial [Elasticomyces elasticus]